VPHKQNMLSGALAQSRMLMGGSLGPQRRKTLEQRVVVSASSLFYLLPSAHMRAVGDSFGSMLFVIVTCCSLLADGSWGSSPRLMQRADKWTATLGGIYAIAPKVLLGGSLLLAAQLLAATAFSFAFIVGARATPPSQSWRWVLAQSAWHAVSATALAWSCYCSGETGCAAPAAFPFLTARS